MLFTLAWRNIKRSKRRTIITLTLSIITTILLIFYIGITDGTYTKIFKDSVEIYPGYYQLTDSQYRDDPSFDHTIEDADALVKELRTVKGIAAVTKRYESFALYSSSENALGGMLTGVDPLLEPKFSRIYKTIKEGRFLTKEDTTQVIIGKGLAKRLKVKLGDSFSMIGTATDYSFAAENLHVVGIFKTGLTEFDNNAVFMNLHHFDALMNAQSSATHIIILPTNTKKELLTVPIHTLLKQHHLDNKIELQYWRQYLKSMVEAMAVDRASGVVSLLLFIAIIFSVVIIYAYLTIYSRIKEIGIMRALGTNPRQIISIVLLETFILALISVVVGSIIGGYMNYYYEIHPIVIPSLEEAYQQYGILDPVMSSYFSWKAIWISASFIFFLNLLSVLYPIWQIARIKPLDAIRHF